MGKMDSLLLRSKFRGSMLGALMGDCLGSAYEGEESFTAGMRLVFQRSLDKLEGPYFKAPVMQFTDDSAMTRAVAESLIEHTGLNQTEMARKFVKFYYQEPNRGYGAGVTTVFHKLRNNKFVDVLGPAREQFNGEGSLGNGGAMRVAPVALFFHKNYELVIDAAKKQSQITHTHKTGVDGAILQAIAIHQSLLLDPKEELDICKYTEDLIEKMDKIEVDEEGLGLINPSPYKTQLKLVKDLICEEGEGSHVEKVVHHLGNDISALHSVPTAIYCFLRAQKPIKDVQTENPLRRTIQYAHEMSRRTDVRFLSNPKFIQNIEWSDNEINKLVCWYRNFPCLWRKDISTYVDNVARHCAYRSIHEAMNMPNVTFTDVMMKIQETRRSYVNELKKALMAQASGCIYQPKSSWFIVIHEFLFPYLDYMESTELDNILCGMGKIGYIGCKSISKSVMQDNINTNHAPAAGDLRHREYRSECEKLHGGRACHPTDFCPSENGQSYDWSCPLYDYWSADTEPLNPPKTGIQFTFSRDSVISENNSSSTIVCEKRSGNTCIITKSVTECGVQWTSSDSKQGSPVSCETSSVGTETKDSAISVEYDEYDTFAKIIASHLRAMDIETALQAKNQIEKVITDHRLHKPETQSIRLLRPETSGGGMAQSVSSRNKKSRPAVQLQNTKAPVVRKIHKVQRTYVPRSGGALQHMVSLNRDHRQNNTSHSKALQSKSRAKIPSLVIEPIMTNYKRAVPSSIPIRAAKTDKGISLGGDTDTIGSMAGAIAGAFYGEDMIRQEVLKHCELSAEFRDLADRLCDNAVG